MKKIFLLLTIVCFCTGMVKAQQKEKVIIISLDGLRWQELYGGADSLFINDSDFVSNPKSLNTEFWAKTKEERREKLMPFFWSHVSKQGVMLGNRWKGNKVNLTNKMLFSYPGYNEILTGKADDEHINSNNKAHNPNITILEKANFSEAYKNKVEAFGSWDVFPFILNEQRSKIPVNAGYRAAITSYPTEKELYLDLIQEQTPRRWEGVRFDVFTHNYALESLKNRKPDVLYIAYGETDDFAHDGRYDQYLKSAKRTDQMIRELWEFVSNDSYYKGKTSVFITTDHGRGTGTAKDNDWRHHGSSIPVSDQTWIIAFGNHIVPSGEQEDKKQYYTTQFTPTIAEILNIEMEQKGSLLPVLEE
ncbi:phosphoglyceromutase [Salegentibacter salinarum]|uniref:Phosphoglyceromutase n=1 Tax=Salegentibacter salinarum TaxID=447422 RepID=A0A2N0TXK4_9FLAO|nr:alkaline phosphatase family protein [Salegentibacter salinarum]PKD19485.1 phosphoglyceromutase [Salegentibacter salinarum]SKB91622.1 phosphoglycerate mutase [Salegentibacter salinarum]